LGTSQTFPEDPGITTLKENGNGTGEMRTDRPSVGLGIASSKFGRYTVIRDLCDEL
jgi:hypothetical protein